MNYNSTHRTSYTCCTGSPTPNEEYRHHRYRILSLKIHEITYIPDSYLERMFPRKKFPCHSGSKTSMMTIFSFICWNTKHELSQPQTTFLLNSVNALSYLLFILRTSVLGSFSPHRRSGAKLRVLDKSYGNGGCGEQSLVSFSSVILTRSITSASWNDTVT